MPETPRAAAGRAALQRLVERQAPAIWTPTIVRADDLLEREMPEVAFLAKPWIPEGVMIVAGRPKLGKTSMVRQWAAAVGNGREFWGTTCTPAGVLFLSLEEGDKLMRRKLMLAGYSTGDVANVSLAFQWRQGIDGCGDILAFLRDQRHVRLLVIDSLTRFREPPSPKKPAFQADYEAVSQLSDVAKSVPGLSIVVIHHTRKSVDADDPIADISGTYGLSAAADSYAVLRKQGSDFVLHCGGRYWDEESDAFTLVRDAGRWQLSGAHDGIRITPVQRRYLERLVQDGTVGTKSMATRMSVKESTASEILGELRDKGLVQRTADGWSATPNGIQRAER